MKKRKYISPKLSRRLRAAVVAGLAIGFAAAFPLDGFAQADGELEQATDGNEEQFDRRPPPPPEGRRWEQPSGARGREGVRGRQGTRGPESGRRFDDRGYPPPRPEGDSFDRRRRGGRDGQQWRGGEKGNAPGFDRGPRGGQRYDRSRRDQEFRGPRGPGGERRGRGPGRDFPQDLGRVFDRLDSNGDGMLSREEFEQFRPPRGPRPGPPPRGPREGN